MKHLESAVLAAFIALSQFSTTWAQEVRWVPCGAAPNTNGQVENVKPNNEVVGAINALAPHPENKDILYVGAVNGGIWMTENATASSPKWESQTDWHESLAIGALAFDPLDTNRKTLVAATGGRSSFGSGGQRIGILVAKDGKTWKALDGGGVLAGLNLSGVVPRGPTIVLSAISGNQLDSGGIWRSEDGGESFAQVSGSDDSGLPKGPCYTLRGDPTATNRLYTNAGGHGIFRSDDQGRTWTHLLDAAMDSLLAYASNVEITVGGNGAVFVAIVGPSRQLTGVFHSPNSGGDWTQMALPTTIEGGIHPGGQGTIHLSLVADPDSDTIVYIGGDRQDGIPNSIGASDYTGRLFRGDVSKPNAQQWVHLTHSSSRGPAGGGTANCSAPHADSRDMAFAADGRLIEADDGGVYVRTSPRDNLGDWFSLNGNLQTSEYHAVAWDSVSDRVIAAAQDTGASEQIQPAQGAVPDDCGCGWQHR